VSGVEAVENGDHVVPFSRDRPPVLGESPPWPPVLTSPEDSSFR
jgi:hypothetical protein